MIQYMPHISRNRLDKQAETHLTNTLDLVLTNLTKREEMKGFLLSFLTPTERLMLAKRLAIFILIREGLSESDIAQTLHVTRVTVSRMQLFLEARGQGYEFAMKVLDNEKTIVQTKEILLKLAGYAVRAAGGRVKPGIF